ncbi:Gfo/Idh/MocA family oxidoreductase [Kineosporia sp. J2-2]|uniref:Gfo/Idh/MocA family oxidoreductase n=1 Tax=Kineosporia corallincola TaxID=2835133 RepID=A0ABS5TB87_9ACTN|nr:Gfo/Idh/MocA family oxidoreductase [Kineosporia corallincola]MBT0767398.1 Gfo/Idh/MocA family oxidoreductase [Kineosporia corallincola]
MTEKDDVKIGLAGFGFGGKYFHAPLIAAAPGVEFAGVVTTSAGRQAEVAELYPGVPTYASLYELKQAGAQAVAISTPAHTHTPLVLEAIELGLAVVSDKPFALNAEAARTAVEAAEKAGVKLSVYQNRRWDADLLTVKKLVETGELGEVFRFESRFERFDPQGEPPAAGGGILRDFGSHLVDQALYLFGPAASVYAELDDVTTDDRDSRFFVSITHTGGVVSHLIGNWREGAPGPRYRVSGSTGSFVLTKPMEGQEALLLEGLNPATAGERWGVEPQESYGHLYRGDEVTSVPTERGSWDTYYPSFAAAVRGEGEVPVDPRDAVATTEVLDAARTSARTGQVVSLGAGS